MSTAVSTTSRNLAKSAVFGAGAGVVASVVMAMYAMFAAWSKGEGFFTPMYHIASLWASPNAMMSSMADAMHGTDFHLVVGTAILGAMIHMVTGAMYGALFGGIVSRLSASLVALAGIGLGYGFLVFLFSSYIGLPLAAAVFGSGAPIKNMAELAGRGTFLIEHLLYGLTLGVLVAVARTRTATALAHA